jgi:transposase
MTLQQKIFKCDNCGISLNRDYNAAMNILSVGASTLGRDGIRRDIPHPLVTPKNTCDLPLSDWLREA